jgi:osmotically inducible protein OsmC
MDTTAARLEKVLYTAEATVTGGRRGGHGRTSDGRLEVDLSAPVEMGGDGGPGTNPEQLFAMGLAGCFQSALMSVARRQGLDAGDSTVTSRVSIGPIGDGRYGLAVELLVRLPSISDRSQAENLLAQAEQRCPYSNAIRGNVEVSMTVVD